MLHISLAMNLNKRLGQHTHADNLCAGSVCASHPHIFSVVEDHNMHHHIYPLFIVSSAADPVGFCLSKCRTPVMEYDCNGISQQANV